MEDKNKIIEENIGLVVSTVKKIVGFYDDDLLQIGFMAFIDAIDSFDPSKGAKVTTWATTKIRSAILDCVKSRDKDAILKDYIPITEKNQYKYEKIVHIDNTIERRNLANFLNEEISKLSEKEKKILQIGNYEGISEKEIANEFNQTQQAISLLRNQIVAKLKSKFVQNGFLT